ncbi:MAG: glycosyltransferase family 4 protein [Rhodospirillaceae bacterium]|nr:glycosyltransferase family 4 protein [Rhodospirillaceae bacterium]MBT7511315.1 glycosyltransferase family 4 protein [Rhodospirillaceae bacterium]
MATPSPNAAFYFSGHNYRTAGDGVVGRQSASGGFLRGFIHHGGIERLQIYADSLEAVDEFQAFVGDTGGDPENIGINLPMTTGNLSHIGTLFRPGPDIGSLAWRRRYFDQAGFSICGITHTIYETMALNVLGNILTAPVQPWDALVCTSKCVKGVIERLLDGWCEYLNARFGGTATIPCQLPIIPLGVDSQTYAARGGDSEARADLRSRMGIADGDIALLYAGRLDHVEKANPVPMYLAAETTQKASSRKIHLIQAGQASTPEMETAFKEAATAFAPSITHHFIDGAMTELYDKVWAAGDIFISLSDNIQESFGLTPIEAMATGLPAVVSDYDGYRESVRDGIDGFCIPTTAPPPGAGAELGFLYHTGYAPYSAFTGAASQSTAVDIAACAEKLGLLIGNEDLRRKFGEAGQQRAAEIYDWRHVVAAHQALWSELAEMRNSEAERIALPTGAQPYPMAPDPFALFTDHPSSLIAGDAVVSANAGSTVFLRQFRSSELSTPLAAVLMDEAATLALLEKLSTNGTYAVSSLSGDLAPEKLAPFYLTLGWLAKMGLISVSPAKTTGGADIPFGVSETWKTLTGG